MRLPFYTQLKQMVCKHAIFIDGIERQPSGLVHATCTRCGKILAATYGLALPAKLEQRPKT